MTFIGANAAGLGNKIDSLHRLVSKFKPAAIFIQETKARSKNKFKIDNYDCFEPQRTNSNGGGLLTAIHKSLNPVESSTDSD